MSNVKQTALGKDAGWRTAERSNRSSYSSSAWE